MKTQLIMLDTPIIVSDEEPNQNDLCFYNKLGITTFDGSYGEIWDYSKCKKIIAGIEGLPKIDWNGLEEEFGWVDAEKLAMDKLKNKWAHLYQFGYPQKPFPTYYEIDLNLVKVGIYETQSLNEKKFSLEDVKPLKELVEEGYDPYDSAHHLQVQRMLKVIEEFIESLQQPKVFDIEVEEEEKFSHYSQDLVKVAVYKKVDKPKITNNSIKILRKL